MKIGAGIDIVAISRMSQILGGSGRNAFLRKVYTPREMIRAKAHPQPIAYFAKTFAAKEAIFKCFGIAASLYVKLTDIEIREGKAGEPIAALSGYFAELASARKISDVLVSVSYDGDYAVAMAVLSRVNELRSDAMCHARKEGKSRKQSISILRANRPKLDS